MLTKLLNKNPKWKENREEPLTTSRTIRYNTHPQNQCKPKRELYSSFKKEKRGSKK